MISLLKMFKLGLSYMQICPNDKYLMHSFPEIKIIYYIKLAFNYLPPIVIALFVWQYLMSAPLAITIVTALFALSLPLQGILWLGKRSQSPLPLNLVDIYNNITLQLIGKGIVAKNELSQTLNFAIFMKQIKLAKLHLGDYFGRHDDNPKTW